MNLNDILGNNLVESINKDKEPPPNNRTNVSSPDLYLFTKWAYKVEKNWYGFSLGYTVPMSWARAIDEVLSFLEKKDPNFKILQIKLKFGGLRFYVQTIDDTEVNSVIRELETLLHDPKLIY